MPTFEIWGTGTYTYTRKITADTKEEAEAEFMSEEPSICHQCGQEGIEIDAVSGELNTTEVEDGDDDD